MEITKSFLKRLYYLFFKPIFQEVQRVNLHNLEAQAKTQQQLADELVKMYKMIDDIKCDRVDVKLNVTIVNELIKIHQSIQELKNEQDRK